MLIVTFIHSSSLCQDLIQLGMSKIGHRKRLLTALQSLPAEDRQPKYKPVSVADPPRPTFAVQPNGNVDEQSRSKAINCSETFQPQGSL